MSYRRSYRIRLVVFLGCLGVLSSLGWMSGDVHGSEIRWLNDIQSAHRLSVESGRPMLLHFWAPWCGPCKEMERTTFVDPNVIRLLGEHYIPVKLNVDYPGSKQIANQYGVQGYPTDLVIAPNGQILARSSQALTAQKYTLMLTDVVAMIQSSQVAQRPSPTASAAPPRPPMQSERPNFTPGSTRPVSYPSYNRNVVPQDMNRVQQPLQQQFRPQQPLQQNMSAAPSQNVMPQQGSYGVQQGPYGATLPSNPPFASKPPLQSQPPMQNQGFVQGRPSYASAVPPRPSQQVPQIPAHQLPGPPSQERQSTPSGYGLEGYCPVELVQSKKWVPGDLRFGAVHEGVTYLFASPELQQRFLADPKRYAPANRGFDIVLSTETGQNVPGKRRHGVFVSDNMNQKPGRIYLFASETTLKKFQNQIEVSRRQAAGAAPQNVAPRQGNYASPTPPQQTEQATKPWWYR